MLPSSSPIKVILDTNVCLDLFVFHDQRWEKITKALASGEIIALTRKDCREEWLAVLHYPHLPVNEGNRAQIERDFDHHIQCLTLASTGMKLPLCSDKDDQKFLEIARDSNAHFLITKDKALLKLRKKIKRLNLFLIETPESFVANLVANPHLEEIKTPNSH